VEEEPEEQTETVRDTQGIVPNAIPARIKEKDPALPQSLVGRRTPLPVSIEEVEDEDFRQGAHPNCGAGEIVAGGFDAWSSDGYIEDDATGISDYATTKAARMTFPRPNSPQMSRKVDLHLCGKQSRWQGTPLTALTSMDLETKIAKMKSRLPGRNFTLLSPLFLLP
jgi:hypothetical protein